MKLKPQMIQKNLENKLKHIFKTWKIPLCFFRIKFEEKKEEQGKLLDHNVYIFQQILSVRVKYFSWIMSLFIC